MRMRRRYRRRYRRRPIRRRRTYRRRFTRRRKPINDRVVNVILPQVGETYVTNTQTGTFNIGLGLQLNSGVGYAAWCSQFDLYRIRKWVLVFKPFGTQTQPIEQGAVPDSGWFYSVPDHDDITAAPSIEAARTKSKYKETRGNRIHKRIVIPNVLTPRYRAGLSLTFGVGPSFGQWIDTRDYNVLHYGVKFGALTRTPSFPLAYEVHAKMYVQFKNRQNSDASQIQNPQPTIETLPTDQEE